MPGVYVHVVCGGYIWGSVSAGCVCVGWTCVGCTYVVWMCMGSACEVHISGCVCVQGVLV